MTKFLDRMDAGEFNLHIVAALVVVVLASYALPTILAYRRNKRWDRELETALYEGRRLEFLRAQRLAQQAFVDLGATHAITRLRVSEALDAWATWQGRAPTGINENRATPEEWEALSLSKCLEGGQAGLM